MIYLDFGLERGNFVFQGQFSSSSKVTGLMGPSGSGKTSILLALAGVLRPQKGSIRVEGRDFFDSGQGINLPPEERRLGVVFQDDLLFPHLSVRDNLLFGYRRTVETQRKLKPEEIFALLDLEPLLDRGVGDLSGGEARRVALGRALLTSPCLLLLDEPLTGLDLMLRDRLLAYLLRLKNELDIPMIYVSHNFSDLSLLADESVLLTVEQAGKNGKRSRVAAFGDPFRILPVTGQFSSAGGVENLIRGEVVEARPGCGCAVVKSGDLLIRIPLNDNYVGAECYVTIRADEIILAVESLPRVSARNVWTGRIEEIIYLENMALVTVNVGRKIRAEVTLEAARELGLRPGMIVHALVKVRSMRSVVLDRLNR
jgi:molybdate transport system ATP-binding protein